MFPLQRTSAGRPLARLALLGSLAVLTLGGVQACSSSESDSKADHSAGSTAVGTAPLADEASDSDATSRTGLAGGASDTDAGDTLAAEKESSAREPSIISTASVSLESGDVDQARQDVQRVVDRARGHVTESSTEADEDGTTQYARMVLRVPADAFDDVLTGLEGVATQTGATTESSDVTTQVIDVESRLATQKASVERIRQLLARASSIKDIAWLESQLSDRQATLDSLTQQQAYLADQTSLSTITVDLTDPSSREDQDDESGFLGGLHRGWDAFTDSLSGLVTVVGAVLPFAVALGLLAWLARLVWRRRRSPRTPPAVAPATDQPEG